MPDQELKCRDCGAAFVHPERDQEFYRQQGYQPPKRCKPCRDRKKQERERDRP